MKLDLIPIEKALECLSYNQHHSGIIKSLKNENIKAVQYSTYLRGSIVLAKRDIHIRLVKAWPALNKLDMIWKSFQQYLIWRHRNILVLNNHARKIGKIHKEFELCQVFMHNCLCQNILIFPLYLYLTKRIDKLWSKGLTNFGLEVSNYFGPKISQKKN